MPKRKTKTKSKFRNLLYIIKKYLGIKGSKTSSDLVLIPHDINNASDENTIVDNADHFDDKIAEDVMVPRSDICAVNENISLEDLQQVILKYGHTRTLVFSENLDNIIGFIHIKDLFDILATKKSFHLKNLMRKHLTCPHSMKLTKLLKKMQYNRTHIAVVVDEYGGTDGIITIENIIEEIVGRIDDEHDTDLDEEKDFNLVEPGIIISNARVNIKTIEKLTEQKITSEDDEIDTIGGLVMSIAGSVPVQGDKIQISKNIIAEIIESTPRMIKKLKIIYSI
ncbi:MAG TPA: CBS domain-containing protein [Candidatus Megaira endosymbiont of Nemacystus decipiens]|nr:CBS domain-containing protein [Candidatus Megaera endosymbiont of Nemacystus decipiens]